MKFEILPSYPRDKRNVVYAEQEQSFDMDVSLKSDFTLMLGCAYLGLDVALSSSEVVNISGFCPREKWIEKALSLPVATQKGAIRIVPEQDLCNGTGMNLFEEAELYFDNNREMCYIAGNTKLTPEHIVQFCENAFFCLSGNVLVGIWIQLLKPSA